MKKFTAIWTAVLTLIMAVLVSTQVLADEAETYLLAADSPYDLTVDFYDAAGNDLGQTVYYQTALRSDGIQSTTRELYGQENIQLVIRAKEGVSVQVIQGKNSTDEDAFKDVEAQPCGVMDPITLVQNDESCAENRIAIQYTVEDTAYKAEISLINHSKEYFHISVYQNGGAGYLYKKIINNTTAAEDEIRVDCVESPFATFDITSGADDMPYALTINGHSNTGCEALSTGENYFTIGYNGKQYKVVLVYPEEKPWENTFTDVTTADVFFNSVKYCNMNGLMLGTSDTTFTPDTPTTRAMVVTTLYRIAGSPKVTGENTFSDVEAGSWYADAVLWANQNKIVLGYDNGKFGTNDNITREQFATILYRYANSLYPEMNMFVSLFPYDDSDVAEYARTPMQFATISGILKTADSIHLCPGDAVSRADLAMGLCSFENVAHYMLENAGVVARGF